MIFVRFYGGLGNQMFQYATGKALAKKRGQKLFFDLREFDSANAKNTKRLYELNRACLEENIATQEEFEELPLLKFSILYPYLRKLIKLGIINLEQFVVEKDFYYQENIFKERDSILIDGYWQSPKYFSHLQKELNEDFTPKIINSLNKQLLFEIQNSLSVAVHIRRGDYVTNPHAATFHGVLPIEYYKNALAEIKKKYKNVKYFVFSDDLKWVEENIEFNDQTVFVDINGIDHALCDIYLMSHCKHHVIANSSFSWWGAWLNMNPDKEVYYPYRWFIGERETKDLIPMNWREIKW